MPITAREEAGNLILDWGDGTDLTIYPVPAKIGYQIQGLLVGVGSGTTMYAQGPAAHEQAVEMIGELAFGIKRETGKRRKAPNRREQELAQLPAPRYTVAVQAATLWNAGGGGIDAVLDLLDEAGGYPKALGRVMASSGLGDQYEALRTWLGSGAGTSATASTKSPTGGPTTSV